MSSTPGSKKQDPVVAAEDDSQPAASSNGANGSAAANGSSSNGSSSKKVSPATSKRDEVVVDVPNQGGEAKDDPSSPDGAKASANDTVTDLKTTDAKAADSAGSPGAEKPAAWATPAEPGGSVFAGRTDAGPPKPAFGAREVVGSAAPAEAPAGGGLLGGPGPVGGPLGGGPAQVNSDPVRNARPMPGGKAPRKAHLQVSRFEPWSVMKFSFVMSLVCFIVLMVAVVVLYVILSGLGVFDAISSTINQLTQEQGTTTKSSFDASSWFSFTRIFAYTALVGALNVLLITALATVWSVIYNIAADFEGGVEVTLKEAE